MSSHRRQEVKEDDEASGQNCSLFHDFCRRDFAMKNGLFLKREEDSFEVGDLIDFGNQSQMKGDDVRDSFRVILHVGDDMP